MKAFFQHSAKLILKGLFISVLVVSIIIGIDRLALAYFGDEPNEMALGNCALKNCEIPFAINNINHFYISPKGQDNSTCDLNNPCLTFSHIESLAQPGDTIHLTGSLEAITIAKSGQPNAPITIQGNNAILRGLTINGDYVHVYNVEVVGSDSHGILVQSKHVLVQDSIVRNSVTENGENGQCGMGEEVRWGSGLKIRVGAEDVILRGNQVFNNCGEGIAITRGARILLEDNIVGSNYSVGIYIDNSYDVIAQNNAVTCDDTYLRNGNRMSGIVVAGELYSDGNWGMQVHDIKILNNRVDGCYANYSAWETDDESPIRNLLIEGNISLNAVRHSIDIDALGVDIVVSNNMIDKPVHYNAEDPGVTVVNNQIIETTP